ncbi:MAG TPA: FAD-dependent oxidoreductase [Thermomicrobiales bacterium]|nr:FAD-dependent oxidoreductase [Thermomicrobiales bacterium]
MDRLDARHEPWPDTADAVVIGGGVVGAATAFSLARAGLRAVVVERKAALGALTTAASAASFRAQFTDAANIALMRESIAVFEHFAEVTGLPGYDLGIRQNGYLFASDREDDVAALRARVARQRDLGLADVEFLDGDEVRRRCPYLDPVVRGAAFRARDGWLDAGRLTHGFARASGARFLLETEVTTIVVAGGRVGGVVTSRGRIGAPVVVVAAGPYSGVVAATAGVDLPLAPVRRHRLIVAPRPAIPPDAPMTIDATTGAHWRPQLMDGGVGALVAWSQDEAPTPPRDPVPPDPAYPAVALAGIVRLSPFWADVIPTLGPADLRLSAGQYTVSPDHNALIGPVEAVAGLYVNAGYSGHGVMASPGGARLLADLVAGRRADADNPFSPQRFKDGLPAATEGERMVL